MSVSRRLSRGVPGKDKDEPYKRGRDYKEIEDEWEVPGLV